MIWRCGDYTFDLNILNILRILNWVQSLPGDDLVGHLGNILATSGHIDTLRVRLREIVLDTYSDRQGKLVVERLNLADSVLALIDDIDCGVGLCKPLSLDVDSLLRVRLAS